MWGDSKVCFVYIQGGLEKYSLGRLILLKQRPHLADRAAIFSAALKLWRLAGGFSKGERRKKKERKKKKQGPPCTQRWARTQS